MKKILLSAIIFSVLLVTTVNAESGPVEVVTILDTGDIQVVINHNGVLKYGKLIGDTEKINAMYAAALTAKVTGGNVTVKFANGGWDALSLR